MEFSHGLHVTKEFNISKFLRYYNGCKARVRFRFNDKEEIRILDEDLISNWSLLWSGELFLYKLSDITEEHLRELYFIGMPSIKEIYPDCRVEFVMTEPKKKVKCDNGYRFVVYENKEEQNKEVVTKWDGHKLDDGVFSLTKLTSKQFVYLIDKEYWLFDERAFDMGLIVDKKTLK